MTNEEAVRKLEYSKKAYQMLIDEKVDSGKLVGKDVKGEWKADTPLDEAYKSMIEALEMGIKAIKALEQEPCGDAIDRAEAIRIASGYCHPANVAKELAKLPTVTPQPKIGHWIAKRIGIIDRELYCDQCGEEALADYPSRFCSNCGAKMIGDIKDIEPQERSGEE